jgi:hypothetical protein
MDDLPLSGEGEDEAALSAAALPYNKDPVPAAVGEEGEARLVPRDPRLKPGLEGEGIVGRRHRAGGGPMAARYGPEAGLRVGDLGGLAGVCDDAAARAGEVHGRVMRLQSLLNREEVMSNSC